MAEPAVTSAEIAARRMPFDAACGSVLGREHALAGRNNQDAYCCRQDEHGLIAVVCDGCSSARHSEVGAKLGARLLVETLHARLPLLDAADPAEFLETARQDMLRQAEALVSALGPERVANVNAYLLFTVVGALISVCHGQPPLAVGCPCPPRAVVFALGDGVAFLNGSPLDLPPANNRPPYLCYALIEGALDAMRGEDLRFRVLADLPSANIETLVLGSDGAAALCGAPAGQDAAGALREFWTEDRFFTNPQTLTRRLVQLNREVKTIDWEARRVDRKSGPLLDDTTLIVIRRRIVPRASGPC